MGPAVEEAQNDRIQKKEALQTDIQEVHMVIWHMNVEAHLYAIYSRFNGTGSTMIHGAWS